MAFIAQRELKVVSRDGKDTVTIYKPGDVVQGFEKWDEVPRRAHLSLEYVREVSDSKLTPQQKVSMPKVVETKSKSKTKREKILKEKVEVKAETPAPAPLDFKCVTCPTKSFKSSKALKTHITLAHAKKESA